MARGLHVGFENPRDLLGQAWGKMTEFITAVNILVLVGLVAFFTGSLNRKKPIIVVSIFVSIIPIQPLHYPTDMVAVSMFFAHYPYTAAMLRYVLW